MLRPVASGRHCSDCGTYMQEPGICGRCLVRRAEAGWADHDLRPPLDQFDDDEEEYE